MFALQYKEFGPPDVLEVADAPEPHAGPGQVRIAARAAGVAPTDARLRAGALPTRQTLDRPHIPGVDAAGVVDEIGDGVSDVAIGDEVFGVVDLARLGGASAEFVVLDFWAHRPAELSWAEAGGAGTSIETATRVLDALSIRDGMTVLIDGASGGVGSVLVRLARARGADVIGTAGDGGFLAGLGARATTYGPGLAGRVAALAPNGVDAAIDVAGAGSVPELVVITGSPDRVITIADFGAGEHGVRISWSGPGGGPSARHGLAVAAELAGKGEFHVDLRAVFPLRQASEAHAMAEAGHGHGKIVLTIP